MLEIENVDLCASQQLLHNGKECSPICWKKSNYAQVLGIKTIKILLYSLYTTWDKENLSEENLKDYQKHHLPSNTDFHHTSLSLHSHPL